MRIANRSVEANTESKDHPDEECPGDDDDDIISCDDCGGEVKGRCKGVSRSFAPFPIIEIPRMLICSYGQDPADDFRYKGCACWPSTSNEQSCEHIPFKNPKNPQPEIDENFARWGALPRRTDESAYAKDPNEGCDDEEGDSNNDDQIART